MQDDLGNLVHPIITHALDLKDRLARGEPADIDVEQAALRDLLLTDLEAKRWADFGGDLPRRVGPARPSDLPEPPLFLGARYALVCWLDELFILYTPWESAWNERKLEVALYGTNERAWKFWEQARVAESRPTSDALEVFFLCVTLGFRGDAADDPARLSGWLQANQARLSRPAGEDWPHPPELDAPTHVPPLRGRDRLARVLYFGGLAVLLLIPIVVFSAVQRFGR